MSFPFLLETNIEEQTGIRVVPVCSSFVIRKKKESFNHFKRITRYYIYTDIQWKGA